MLGGDDGSGPSAGRRKAGTSAGGRGVPVRRKLWEAGGEKDHGVCGAGAGRQERQRHFAEHEKSAHASDAGAVAKGRRTLLVSPTEVAGGAAVRVEQARTGLPALQFAGPQESSSGVATGLRGVKSEENRGPDHLLTTTGKARKATLRGRRKINPLFLVALHAESALGRFLKMFCGTNSYAPLLIQQLFGMWLLES